jgi:hypothetical protein
MVTRWEAATPHPATPYFFFFLAAFFFAIEHLTSSPHGDRTTPPSGSAPYFFFFLAAFFFAMG